MGLGLTADELQDRISAIEQVLSGRGSNDLASYTINGRSITKIPIQDLIRLLHFYNAELERVNTEASIAAGNGNPRKIRTRFV